MSCYYVVLGKTSDLVCAYVVSDWAWLGCVVLRLCKARFQVCVSAYVMLD